MRRAQAVSPGVAAPDDDHALPCRADQGRGQSALLDQVRGLEVLHGEVDPRQPPPGGRKVARHGGPSGEDHGVEGGADFGGRAHRDAGPAGRARASLLPGLEGPVARRLVAGRPADLRVADEGHPFGLELGQASVEDGLLHLELGDAVAQQSAGVFGTLEDGHVVPGPGQLLGGGQPGRSGPDDGHRLAGVHGRDLRRDPALVPGALDDLVLDPLNGHRVVVDAEHARRLARGRAQAPGELREVVGGVEPLHGLRPVVAVHKVVPLRNEVAERAAVVAEGDAAVHAAGTLLLGGVLAEGLVDLLPVPEPDGHRPPPRAGGGGAP